MKKREILATLAMASVLGVSACGTKELTLTADHIEVELGSNPAAEAVNYVSDADIAAEAAVDFSAVDVTKTGTYRAVVTYKDQTAEFEVAVVDTTAPEVMITEEVVVAAGEPLYAKDVITGVTELSGKVEVVFQTPEETPASEEPEAEAADTTEKTDDTETADTTEKADDAETADEAERAEESAELSAPEQEAEFALGDVLCSNAYVVYTETGEYDNTLTVTDASGNSTEVTVHVTVGSAPEIKGVKNITAASGQTAETVDYLEGVTAVDSSGNDITADIVCDSSAVDLTTAGEYTVVYTVTDKDGFTATESAIVTVEEKSAKKPDEKKSGTSGKDSGDGNKNGNTSKTSGNGGNASDNGGNSGNAGASGNTGTSGNTGNAGNTNGTSGNNTSGGSTSGNSGNTGGTSGNVGSTSGDTGNAGNTNGTSGGNTSSDSGNSGNTGNAPADTGNTGNGGNTNTPSTDNGGNTSTPSTDTGNTGTPDAGNTNTGSTDGGMSVPDDVIWLDPDTLPPVDPGNNGHGGGSADGTITFN